MIYNDVWCNSHWLFFFLGIFHTHFAFINDVYLSTVRHRRGKTGLKESGPRDSPSPEAHGNMQKSVRTCGSRRAEARVDIQASGNISTRSAEVELRFQWRTAAERGFKVGGKSSWGLSGVLQREDRRVKENICGLTHDRKNRCPKLWEPYNERFEPQEQDSQV